MEERILLERAFKTKLKDNPFVQSLSKFYLEKGFLSWKQKNALEKLIEDTVYFSKVSEDEVSEWEYEMDTWPELSIDSKKLGITQLYNNHYFRSADELFYGDGFDDEE